MNNKPNIQTKIISLRNKLLPRHESISFYEQAIPFKELSYYIYWVVAGIFVFILGEVLIFWLDESSFILPQLIFAFGGYSASSIAMIKMAYSFQSTLSALETVLETPAKNNPKWNYQKSKEFFSYQTFFSKVGALTVCLLGTASILYLGIPFQSIIAKILAVVGLIPVFAVSGHAVYIVINSQIFLNQLIKYPLKTPFYRAHHPAFTALITFYSNATFIVLGAYILVVLLIVNGPYGLTPTMLIWATVLAIFPFLMFGLSFYQIHNLLQRIKQEQIDLVNSEVQKSLTSLKTDSSNEKAELLSSLMDIQQKVESMQVWQIDIRGSLTFVVTLAVAVFQIMALAREFLKP